MCRTHRIKICLRLYWTRGTGAIPSSSTCSALPEGGLEARAMEGGPSVAELFTHIHYVRLVFVFEDAPEFARNLPEEEWVMERDPRRIRQMLKDSAKAGR